MWLSRILGGLGRVLVTAGALILLFVAYQLWGTNIHTARAQSSLTSEFEDVLATVPSTTAPATTAPATTAPSDPGQVAVVPAVLAPADLPLPAYGDPIAQIKIPKIGVDAVVVEGVGLDQLKRGPGHYQETPLPGQRGNAAIAGHRTTYGAPFGDIDKLEPGDEIRVTTVQGEFVYTVAGQQIVQPEQVEVVDDFGDNRLTLSACHPKFSAAQRIIVWAELQGEPVATVPRPTDRRTIDVTPTTVPPVTAVPPSSSAVAPAPADTTAATTTSTTAAPTTTSSGVDPEANHLAGDPGGWPGAIGWGLACLAVALVAWLIGHRLDVSRGRRWTRRWAVYAASSPLVAITMFLCFASVDRLLPAY